MDRRTALGRLAARTAAATTGRLTTWVAAPMPAALLSANALLPITALAAPAPTDRLPGVAPVRTAQNAWQRNFAAVPESFGPTRLTVRNALPKGLRGVLYRNGPAQFHRGGLNYRHWFDGDGMVQAFTLTDDGIEHRARMIRTTKYQLEEKAGRLLYPGFGTALAEPAGVSGPDDMNVANISVLPINRQLLALWEAGSAYQIDPVTLETRGRQVWSADTDGLPFSAHPKVQPDGTVWSFGYQPGSGKLVLYQFDRNNTLRRTGLIETANADMVHDFAITGRYLVFVLMPLVFGKQTDGGARGFLGKYRWQGELPSLLVLVDKHSLQIAHRIELPPMALFHFANAWDDGSSVRVQLMRIDDFDALNDDIYRAMAGQPAMASGRTRLVEIVATPSRRQATVSVLQSMDAEFPRIDPRRVGASSHLVFACCRIPNGSSDRQAFGFNGVCSVDTGNARVHRFDYGAHVIAEEHIYVPRQGAPEGHGWLIGTAYDWLRERSLFSVFDAQSIDAGPISQATLPYAVPLGLHGEFVPRDT